MRNRRKIEVVLPPPRFILIFIVFSFLTCFFCSKGDRTIEPIMPPPGYEPPISESDMIYVGDSRGSDERTISGYHSRLSPFMPEDIFKEMDSKLTSIIGDGEVPKGQFIFLHAEPSGALSSNPPIYQVAFVAPRNSISPDDISILIDNNDISKLIIYCVHYSKKRKASFYIGAYKSDSYLNPLVQHQLIFKLQTLNNEKLQKDISFGVSPDENLSVSNAFFLLDSDKKNVFLNKLFVAVNLPREIKVDKSLDSALSWTITYQDGAEVPPIQFIEKLSYDSYVINFAKDVVPEKIIKISFSPSEGIQSKAYELKVPIKYDDRGGGYFRKGAIGDCRKCNGHYIMTLDAFEAEPCVTPSCGNMHRFTLWVFNCPNEQICDGQLNETHTWTNYWLPPNNYCDDGLDSYICPPVLPPQSASGQINCASFSQMWPCYKDVIQVYSLVGYPVPPNGAECPLAGPVSDSVHSDVEPPYDISVMFSLDQMENCDVDPEYKMGIMARDNHCVQTYPIFCLKYMAHDPPYGTDGQVAFPQLPGYYHYSTYDDYTEFTRSYLIDDPNIFACVEYLKVVIKDEKGNWNSKYVYPGGNWMQGELPYPASISMNFGNRTTYVEGDPPEAFSKQYVNLEHHFNTQISPITCVRMIDNPNHGPMIYIEVTVDPPLPGIRVLLEYTDPQFRTGQNKSPTNTVDCPDDIDPTKFTPTYNGNLTKEQYNLMWGKHDPWWDAGCDWEDDDRTLGDNYNYYYEYQSQRTNPIIPPDDPIKYFSHAPNLPCFENPDCTGLPEGVYCLNYYCAAGEVILQTNKQGKIAVYFNTQSHGGDNFQFKACGYYNGVKRECLSTSSNIIFTVWRRIKIDLAWMEPRNDTPDDCNEYPDEKEYPPNSDYQISENQFSFIQGVYDDAFIEIANGRALGPNTYFTPIPDGFFCPSLHCYADSFTGFHDPPLDSVELISADHGYDTCANGLHGETVPLPAPPEYHWHSFVFSGEIFDGLSTRKYRFYIDREWYTTKFDFPFIIGPVSSHELLHLFTNCDNGMHIEVPYGLECTGGDERSYLHHTHIMGLRAGQAGLHYEEQQRCFNTAGITYFDLVNY